VVATGASPQIDGMKIVAIPESFAQDVRRTRRDGHRSDLTPTEVTEAHAAPCRVCLQDAHVGDSVLLCTYNPFERPGPYVSTGPVFVHAHGCTPYAPGDGVTDALTRRLLSLRGYDAEGHMRVADVVEGRDLEARAASLFAEDAAIVAVHVHHARAGCFACRIER
jgi:hypothetical protein